MDTNSILCQHPDKVLYGRSVALRLNARTAALVNMMTRECGLPAPELAVVSVGKNRDDFVYRTEILRQAKHVGIGVRHVALPADVGGVLVSGVIDNLNHDPSVSGVLVQTMRNKELRRLAQGLLVFEKDVEDVTARHVHQVMHGESEILPCTPGAIVRLIEEALGPDLKGVTLTVVNSSPVIGLPLACLLAPRGVTTTLCNSGTGDLLPEMTSRSRVLVTAVGVRPGLIGRKHVSRGQLVIDAAIIRVNGCVRGDVALEEVIDIVDMITPVPGGVGPVTTATLMDNTAQLAARAAGLEPYMVDSIKLAWACALPQAS